MPVYHNYQFLSQAFNFSVDRDIPWRIMAYIHLKPLKKFKDYLLIITDIS